LGDEVRVVTVVGKVRMVRVVTDTSVDMLEVVIIAWVMMVVEVPVELKELEMVVEREKTEI
jgi:hypothetical protein